MTENELDYDVAFLPGKRSRHLHYEMKLVNKKTQVIIHARKSKNGGATIAKLFDDAMFLFLNGAWNIEEWVKNNELEKIIAIQEKYYNESVKVYGFPVAGWSPETIKNIREASERMKKK